MSTLSIKIGAVLDGSFNAAMKGSSGQLSSLGENIRRLGSSLKSVSKFKQLGSDVLASKKSWKGFEDQVKSLAKQIKAVEKPSKTLKDEFDKAKTSATKAKEAFLKKRDALHSLNEEVRKSGADIKSLVRDQYKLGSSVEALKSKYSKLGSVISHQQGLSTKKAHYRSQVIGMIGSLLSVAVPIKIAVDFESAMINFKSAVTLSRDKEINNKMIMEVGQELKKLSREIPLSAVELVEIATSGGRLGLSKDKIIQFTEAVAKMAVNFGMTGEEVGSATATLSNIYRIGSEKMEELGDTLNHLASNTTVDPKDMMSAMTVAGGAAKQFGLNVHQTAGLVNAFVSLGKQPKKAAGVISDILIKLQTARNQDDKFIETLEEVGIDIDELEENIKKDPQGTLLKVFEALRNVPEDERPDIILRLFDSGSQDDIALIVENLEKYKEVLRLLADEKERVGSLGKEFEDHVSTTAKQLQLFKNSIAEVGVNLGSVMLPTLNLISGFLRSITTGIAWFAETCPILTTGIMSIISACVLLKLLVLGGSYALALLQGSFLTLKAILHGQLGSALISLSARMIPAVITGFRALTLAMVSNPIGAAIAVLATGAALVITNWGKVKDFFASFWEYIKSIIKPIGEAFSWMGSTVSSIFGGFSENSPIKKFEDNGSVTNELSKNSIFSNGDPLASNSAVRQLSKNSKNNLENLKVKSVIEEKRTTDQEEVEKALKELIKSRGENRESKVYNQAFYQTFNINIKSEPNQDVRSIADAVIERFREQARGALFDTVEELY
ncbi:phage tail tape measure protein [Trichonephila clavata]|uniref:Phage tail tape measure protein n=1 Tax=Trichonephila clavata TaxID=2740835 RepID=A0A8X6JIR1_TRICU|nr:phage tail tape measure protein [Trichonephila clavata]